MRILIVDDERRLAGRLQRALVEERHTADVAHDGITGLALALATDATFDVIVLDVQLPGLDGLEVCRQLRDACVFAPILVCSARDGVDDCVAGFEAGADDYLVKPFALEEFLARVHALGRRRQRPPPAPATSRRARIRAVEPVELERPRAEDSAHRGKGFGGYLRQAWTAYVQKVRPIY